MTQKGYPNPLRSRDMVWQFPVSQDQFDMPGLRSTTYAFQRT